MGLYATLDDVKMVLLSGVGLRSGGRGVDFSESFRDLRSGPNNTGNVDLSRVDFDDSYFGVANFALTFTSSTTFDAAAQAEGNDGWVSIGSGDTGNVFTALNPMLTPPATMFVLQPGYWTGSAQTTSPDVVSFRSTSAISNTMAETIIDDASFFIDSMIISSRYSHNPDMTQLLFATGTIPEIIKKAAKYLSAYFIWMRVHREADEAASMVEMWRQQSTLYVENYIRAIPRKGPAWYSRKPVVPTSVSDKIDLPTFGGGLPGGASSVDATINEIATRLRDFSVSPNTLSVTFP